MLWVGSDDLRDAPTRGRSTTSASAKSIGLVLKADTSFKSFLATLEARLRLRSSADAQLCGRSLLQLARHAHANRRFDLLESVCDSITALLPDTPFARTARYHKAHCLRIKGNPEQARVLLSQSIELAPAEFKARALLTFAGTFFDTGETRELAAFSAEALNASRGRDILSEAQAVRNLAIANAVEGNHEAALNTLERLLPTMRIIGAFYPVDLLSHLNSLAIELGEVGRVDEANKVIDYILGTPYADRQPEWHNTKLELATKPRKVFAPFTMSLGAPRQSVERLEPKSERIRLQSCDKSQHSKKARHSKKPQRSKKPVEFQRTLQRKLHRTHRDRIVRSPHPVQARSGYAVSPPARAPPLT